MKLLLADVRRRAPAEVSKFQLPPLKRARPAIQFVFLYQRVQVDLNIRGVLVRVDFEIAKLAALATERNVDIEAKGISHPRSLIEGRERVANELRFPLRERRIIRNEVVSDFRSRLWVIYRHLALSCVRALFPSTYPRITYRASLVWGFFQRGCSNVKTAR